MDELQAICIFILILLLVLRVTRSPKIESPLPLPPSPPSLPIIGHLHLLGRNPHHTLFHLSRKYGHGGFMLLKLGKINTLVASSPDAAKQVLRTHDLVFASRPITTASKYFGYQSCSMSYSTYGEQWRTLRKLCTLELLTPRRVEMFQDMRKQELDVLLNEILQLSEPRKMVNVTDKLSDLTFNIMTRMVMNKCFSAASCNDEKVRLEARRFKDWITEACGVATNINIGEFIPWLGWTDRQISKIKVYFHLLDDHIQKEVDDHRKKWQEGQQLDFIGVMISLSLDDTSIKALAMDMIVAGTDTAAVTVEWALCELLNNPHTLQKARQELDDIVGPDRELHESHVPQLKYLQAIVKESLRLHPSAPLLLPHESTRECEIDGFVVPAKTRLIVNAYAIGRDPIAWEQAEVFDPERFMTGDIDFRGQDFELLPFGSGRRMCPGMLLGVTMVHVMLGSLIHRFEWSIPDGGREIDMSEEFGMTLPRKSPLLLIPASRC